MKKKTVHIILLTLGVILVVSYLIFALSYFKINEDEIKCTDLIVQINGSMPLLSEDDIHAILNQENIHPIGNSLNNLKTHRIEQCLEANPYVTYASSYFTPNGLVYLQVNLREPKFIVAAGENYYIDRERVAIPIPLYASAYLPIVTGRVTKSMAKTEIFDFIDYLEKDAFWNAQIAQIHIKNDHRIELSPRVGDTTILLNDLQHAEGKLNQVYRFYEQCFGKIGWNRYRTLDLRFENQIIGIRN